MGEIVGAGIIAHAPTIMMSKEERYELNEGKEISLVPGFQRLREEVLDVLKPDTVIVLDTHWGTLFELVVTAHAHRKGKYTSEEVPRGLSQIPYDLKGDPELAKLIAEESTIAGTRCTPIDDPYLPIHYPTVNLASFLNKGEAWLSIGMLMAGEVNDFLMAGAGIGRAIEKSGRRAVILASGSMSHTFYPFQELDDHEASDPSHVFPEARKADERRLKWFYEGDHASVIDTMDEYYKAKPEGRFGHYLMMAAAIGGRDCKAKGRLFSEYENSVGTSQVHVWFDRPEDGWTA